MQGKSYLCPFLWDYFGFENYEPVLSDRVLGWLNTVAP
jgi:hypothetical protein